VEGFVLEAHYIADSSRLHLLTSKIMGYIDLISDDTQLPSCDQPPLSFLPQPFPLPNTSTTTDNGADELYDVFISHAGPDKQFIAEPLFEELVANGLKVFFDKRKLYPGHNASQKMETTRIAVVILSPQFACRLWTMKELLCLLRRFRMVVKGV